MINRQEIIKYCLSFPGAYEDYLGEKQWAIIRHGENKKGFAYIFERRKRVCVSLKCDPAWRTFFGRNMTMLSKRRVVPMIKMPNGKALTKEMFKALPLYCYVDTPTKRLLKNQGMLISEKTRLEISSVRYMGEAGGVTCFVELPEGRGVLGMSATQVCFTDEGAIYGKINEYREARIQWLKQEELKDKALGRGGRINVMEANRDGSMKYSVDDGTEIVTFPKKGSQADIAQADITPDISRNSPCPCGSGKKYKKCCGVQRA
jgi:hypothetical protein